MTGKNGNYRENPVFPFRGQKAVDSGKRYGLRSPWSVPNFPANCAEALLPIKQPTNGSLQQGRIARGLPHRKRHGVAGEKKMRAIMVCMVSGSVGQVVIGSDAPRKGDIVTIKLYDENGNIVRETGTVAEVL